MSPPTKIWITIGVFALAVVATGVYQEFSSDKKLLNAAAHGYPTADDLRLKATNAILIEATNELPGISRIVDVSLNLSDRLPDNWTGTVTLDFINHFGGVDRTNIPFKFHGVIGSQFLSASWDVEEYERRFNAQMATKNNP